MMARVVYSGRRFLKVSIFFVLRKILWREEEKGKGGGRN